MLKTWHDDDYNDDVDDIDDKNLNDDDNYDDEIAIDDDDDYDDEIYIDEADECSFNVDCKDILQSADASILCKFGECIADGG